MQAVTMEVTEGLRDAIAKRADLVCNPMNIVGVGMELMNKYPTLTGSEKRALLIKCLHNLAAGKDGVLGTADDAIPKPIVDAITKLVDGNLINDIISLVADVAKGRFDTKKAVAVASEAKGAVTGCVGILSALLKKMPKKK